MKAENSVHIASFKRPATLWLLTGVIALFAVYIPYFMQLALYPKLFALQLLTLVVVLVLMRRNTVTELPAKPLFLLYLAFVLSLIPSCFYAINPARALSEWMKLLSFFVFFVFALSALPAIDYRKLFSRALLVLVALSLAVAAFQVAVLRWDFMSSAQLKQVSFFFGLLPVSEDLHQQTYFIKSVFAHRNLFAHILLLCFPFLLYSARKERGGWRVAALILIFLSIVPLVFLYVRTVWFMLAIVLAWVLVMGLITSSFTSLKLRNILLIVLAAGSVAGGMYMWTQHNEKLSETFEKQGYWINDPSLGSVNERLLMWKATLPMIKDHTVFGVGPGNWGLALPHYAANEIRAAGGNHYTQFQRAHNDYLQGLAEYGVTPFVLYFLLIAIIAFRLVRKLFRETDKDIKLWVLALSAFIVAYAGISMVSFPKERIEHSFLLVLVLAIAILETRTKKEKTIHVKSRSLYVGLAFVLMLASAHTLSILRSDWHMRKAFDARALGAKEQYTHYKAARTPFYNLDPTGTPLGFYQAFEYSATGSMAMAKRYLQDAIKHNPGHKHSLNDLGSVLYTLNGAGPAQVYYQKALALSPGFNDANINMAITLLHSQQWDSSWHYLARCDTPYTLHTYQPAWNETAWKITEDLYMNLEPKDSQLKTMIRRMQTDRDWMWLCHEHAIENRRSFRKQVVEESVYTMLELDKTIDANQAGILRKRFNIE